MPVKFTVLASGSRGNSSLVRSGGSGTLIDLGLGPRALSSRLDAVETGWDGISSALLTHTHGDHVKDPTLRLLALRSIPFYCHEGHRKNLACLPGFNALDRLSLVRHFDERPFLTPDGRQVEPIPLSHDGGPTFGFRIEARPAKGSRSVAIGYLADTGCWKAATADALAEVDVLAVEFNHDIELQKNSGRAPYLIARNLGDRGHLSNDQGAKLVSAVLGRSRPQAVRHVVLLHLSEQCNRPRLALDAARAAVKEAGRRSKVHAAAQHDPFPHLPLQATRGRVAAPVRSSSFLFPWEESTEGRFRLEAE